MINTLDVVSGQNKVKEMWNEVLVILEKQIPKSTFEPWILPMVPQSVDENYFTVLTGHMLAKQILIPKYYAVIVDAIKQVTGKELNFNIVVDTELRKQVEKQIQKEAKKLVSKEETKQEDKYDNLKQMQSFCNLNLKYKFENFVVGAGTKFAYSVAKVVAENPGKKYNPLFIYGNSGLGKTHLMQSIGHHILYTQPELRVKYIKSEEFLNELIQCLIKGGDVNSKMNKFRQKYRNIDVLLIDDIQFIEGKDRMKEEMFNTFETLYQKGKQIVFTSDRQPKDIQELPERLRSRFEMGIIADVQPPDIETRMAILSNLAKEHLIELPFEIINFIASIYTQNVRELEGAFNKITAYASIYEKDLTLDVVKKALNYTENKRKITPSDVLKTVSDYFNVSDKDILGTTKAQKIATARQIAMYLAKELTDESLVNLGKFFGKKHSTVLYAYEKIKEERQINSSQAAVIEELSKRLV